MRMKRKLTLSIVEERKKMKIVDTPKIIDEIRDEMDERLS